MSSSAARNQFRCNRRRPDDSTLLRRPLERTLRKTLTARAPTKPLNKPTSMDVPSNGASLPICRVRDSAPVFQTDASLQSILRNSSHSHVIASYRHSDMREYVRVRVCVTCWHVSFGSLPSLVTCAPHTRSPQPGGTTRIESEIDAPYS